MFSFQVLGLHSKIQPRVSQYDSLPGNIVNGSWETFVARLTTRCLCLEQIAVTCLVGSTCWVVMRFILRGCVVRSEFHVRSSRSAHSTRRKDMSTNVAKPTQGS